MIAALQAALTFCTALVTALGSYFQRQAEQKVKEEERVYAKTRQAEADRIAGDPASAWRVHFNAESCAAVPEQTGVEGRATGTKAPEAEP